MEIILLQSFQRVPAYNSLDNQSLADTKYF